MKKISTTTVLSGLALVGVGVAGVLLYQQQVAAAAGALAATGGATGGATGTSDNVQYGPLPGGGFSIEPLPADGVTDPVDPNTVDWSAFV